MLDRRPAPRRARGVAALALALALGPALAGCSGQDPVGQVEPAAIDLDPADAAACDALLADLDGPLAGLEPHAVDPEQPQRRAWGDPEVVVTCGVALPREFDQFAQCQEVRMVGWFVPDSQLSVPDVAAVATAAGYEPRVAVTVPAEDRGDVSLRVLSELASPVREHLTRVQRCH